MGLQEGGLGDSEGRYTDEYAEMTRQPEATRMGDAVPDTRFELVGAPTR
jgi:hypothetical protein